MIIFRKSIPRRAVLRGIGASLALPMLDAMVPALAEVGRGSPGNPPTRVGFVYFPNGAIPGQWIPKVEGSEFQMSPILEPLAPYRDSMLVLTGLDNSEALAIAGERGGEHPRASAGYLTCVHPVVQSVEGLGGRKVGVSLDQVFAREYGKYTELASLELGIESDAIVGSCDGDSCSYNSTISWRDETTPLPIQNHPRAVFERLFGDSDSTKQADRMARIKDRRSLLDFVGDVSSRLMKDLGASDREKLDQYLDATRDVERRIQMAEEQSWRELPSLDKPAGIPRRFDDHARLMFDLMVLAFQTDLTRVGTFMLGREMSTMAYPEIGVPDPYHPLTHHQGDISKIEKAAKINAYHSSLFAYFIDKLRSTQDGDGNLLDNSLITYGGGLGDANMHLPKNLPILLFGGSKQINGGRHLRFPTGTPLANLYTRMLDLANMPTEAFGDSNGNLKLLTV
jgi:hypothetical protein